MQQFAWSGNRPPNASPGVICKCRGRLAPLHETRKRMEDPHFLPFPLSAPYPASRRRLPLRSFASRTRNRRPRIQEYADRERARERERESSQVRNHHPSPQKHHRSLLRKTLFGSISTKGQRIPNFEYLTPLFKFLVPRSAF